MRLSRKHVLTYSATAITILTSFAMMWLINRSSGVDVYGKYVIILTVTSMLTKFLSARTSEGVIKFFIEFDSIKSNRLKTLTLVYGHIIDLSLGLLLLGLSVIFSDYISLLFTKSTDISEPLILYSICVFLSFVKSTPTGFFQSIEKIGIINKVTIIENLIKVFLLLIFIYVLKWETSLLSVVMLCLISTIIPALYMWYEYIYEVYNGKFICFNRSVSHVDFKERYIKFTITTFLSSTLKSINLNGDTFILGLFTSPSVVGIYDSLKKIVNVISFLSIPLPLLYASAFSKSYINRTLHVLWKKVIKINFLLVTISILVTVVIYQLFPFIMRYMNISENLDCEYIIMSISIMFNVIVWWGRIYSNVVNPIISLKINIYISLFIVMVYPISVKTYQMSGLIISTLILNLLIFLVYCYYAKREMKSE
ncbi:oligosaccharide flippase family protein [Vibrio tritonius]|uniref:Oligosaccharide flippase family protein n=1 Tax=Vibrio tritonius TaxID=1435069 RepID=A0ABS7YKX1_9VIBR|nr:oligosaccharide flippase family protein [Vibrio tritonius]